MNFEYLKLCFFRDLNESQRHNIFVNLKVISADFGEILSHNIENILLNTLKDRLLELNAEILFEKAVGKNGGTVQI